jgi:predicted DsbA family dithiol-disulfide isomerase
MRRVQCAQSSGGGEPRKRVEVQSVFDPMCPWCMFGLVRLRAFMASRDDVVVRTVPYVFDEQTPSPPLPWTEYVQLRYPERASSIFTHKLPLTKQVAASLGIQLCKYEERPISPTVDALRLFHPLNSLPEGARSAGELALAESLLRAAFTGGLDISDRGVLLACAKEAGLTQTRAEEALRSADSAAWVESETRRAKVDLGVTSVPSYVLTDRATGTQLCLAGSDVDWSAALGRLLSS